MCPTNRHVIPLPSPEGFRTAFDVLDADRDGKISPSDLKTFYSSALAGPAATDDDAIASMISAADYDRNGFVDFDEFERVLLAAQSVSEPIMEEVFRVMDRDGDGRVGFEDLKKYLEWAGMGLGDEEVRAMMRIGGGGDDDEEGIGYERLVQILAVEFGR